MDYLLDRLQKLDKEINEAERALTHLNKQVGAKISKIGRLKNEYEQIRNEYRQLLDKEDN